MKMISFVVDKLPLHYYQAELLLYSLEKNSNYTKEQIIVQCLNRVDQYFLNFLKEHKFSYVLIEPYLDGKYCNKLQQLEYFEDKDVSGVILMDTDMFVIEDFASEFNNDTICAKIVDAPNPSLKTLQNIYKAAQLSLPHHTPSDWNIPNNLTFDNNFNGGFYYIPKKHISVMNVEWKKWAEWLYAKPSLFEIPAQFIHVDQISFSLALHANRLAYNKLEANYNFPIHSSREISSFKKELPLKILHYHREINDFGILNDNHLMHLEVKKSIKMANNTILDKEKNYFFAHYKRYLSEQKQLLITEAVKQFAQKLHDKIDGKKIRLYLHAGTPKTATTSLQYFSTQHQKDLEKENLLYPNLFEDSPVPKHQWIVTALKNNDFDRLYKNLANIIDEAQSKKISRIFLSTEGIYNHWWDYSAHAKAVLQTIFTKLNATLLITFRDGASFAKSLYIQNMKNPRIPTIECYGKDWSFEKMMEDKWFMKHLDYAGFLFEVQHIFGRKNIKIFSYDADIVNTILKYLEISLRYTSNKRENQSPSALSVSLLQLINQHNITNSDKQEIVQQLNRCDKILKKYSQEINIEDIKRKLKIQKDLLDNFLD